MKVCSQRQLKILKKLLDKEYVTTEMLSNYLHVSDRTIRNDIYGINELFPGLVIQSRTKGVYSDDLESLLQIIGQSDAFGPKEYTEFNVLKQILSTNHMDIYEFADRLFMSDSSLTLMIRSINQKLQSASFKSRIRRKNNTLFIECDEDEKRRILFYFLMHEYNDHSIYRMDYQSMFSSVDLSSIREISIVFLKKHKINIRDIELISFTIHVALMIERTIQGNSIGDIETVENTYYVGLAEEYLNLLSEKCSWSFNKNEVGYLANLFAGKVLLENSDQISELETLVNRTLHDIKDAYGIDFLEDMELKEKLLVHLVGLNNRVRHHAYLNNPMKEQIKIQFPILFDISVYMADQIQEYFSIHLYEDEISYLTLHLMGSLERIKKKNSKKVVILSPLGESGFQYFSHRIQFIHEYKINVIQIISMQEINSVYQLKPDLVLSFYDEVHIDGIPVYTVQNFLDNEDIENIYSLLNVLNKEDCSILFEEDLFFAGKNFACEEDAIHFLCEKLKHKCYVQEDYENLILEREKVAPTAYGNLFAIPHPIKREGIANKVAVCILRKSIEWDSQKVKVIFLASLARKNNKNFEDFFARLTDLLSDYQKAKKLSKVNTYKEFMEIFLDKKYSL